MELFLLRHGYAEQKSASGRDVDRRLLTDKVGAITEAIDLCGLADAIPTLILSSPYIRAMQTTEIACLRLGYGSEIHRTSALEPDSSPKDLWEELRIYTDESRILAVGHQPLLSSAASWMIGSTRVVVDFTPATIVRIDFEQLGFEPQGVLKGIFTPRLFDKRA